MFQLFGCYQHSFVSLKNVILILVPKNCEDVQKRLIKVKHLLSSELNSVLYLNFLLQQEFCNVALQKKHHYTVHGYFPLAISIILQIFSLDRFVKRYVNLIF